MLNIFFGRENLNKDKFVFDNMKGKTVLVVPDQFTLEAERDAFFYLERKGLMDVEILNFSRMGVRILNQVGPLEKTMIDKQGRHMLLTKIMRKHEETLGIYKGYSKNTRFIQMTNDFISEIKQYGGTPESLAEVMDGVDENTFLSKKLVDIHRIFSEYEKLLEGKYVDTEDLIDLYVEKIPQWEQCKESIFWIYGFDYFTPKNLKIIEKLVKTAKEANVVLTWDDGKNDSSIFEIGDLMIKKLTDIGDSQGIETTVSPINIKYKVNKPEALEVLEQELFAIPFSLHENSQGVTLVQASNFYTEAKTAATKVLQLVREKGLKYKDILLVCNDLSARGEVYKRVFSQYGLELFIDEKRGILHNPAVVYVNTIMDIISEGYKREHIILLLKTGLTDIDFSHGEDLENYLTKYRVSGSGIKKPFDKGINEYGPDGLEKLNEIREKIVNDILDFAEKFKEGKTVKDKVLALYDFLNKKGKLPEKIETLIDRQIEMGNLEIGEETAQVWNVIVDVLEQLVAIIGEEKITMKDFDSILRAGFESVEIGLLPPTVDGLMMGTMQRTRTSGVKVLLILGANEGILPTINKESSILSEDEKVLLNEKGIEICKVDNLRLKEENLGIYKNIAKAEEEIWISYSASDEEGNVTNPSNIFNKVKEIFNIIPRKDIENNQDPEELIDGINITLEHISKAMRSDKEALLEEPIKEASIWYKENLPRDLEIIEAGMNYKQKYHKINEDIVSDLYKKSEQKDFIFSPSRIESYGRCPFSHFVKYGLRPEEIIEYEIGALDIGEICHRCLMILSQRLTEDGMEIRDEKSLWMTIDDKELEGLIDEILTEEGNKYREGLLKDQPYKAERMKELCISSAKMIIEHVRKGKIIHMEYEVPFGKNRTLDPIEIDCDIGKVYVEGKIDRVDFLPEENVKIIDYKSGKDAYNFEEAKAGWKLQLFIYLKAAAGKSRKQAGAFYFHIAEPQIDCGAKELKDIKSNVEKAVEKTFQMDGFMLKDETVIESITGEFDKKSDIVHLKINKDGEVKGSTTGVLLSEEEFEYLTRTVSVKVEDMCKEIVAGHIEVEPRTTKKYTACAYCNYRGICKFDVSFEGCNYIKI